MAIVPAPPKLNNPAVDPHLLRYYEQIDRLTGRALAGQVDERTFTQELIKVTTAAILLMFLLAGGSITSPAGVRALQGQQKIARESAGRLAGDIFDGRYSTAGGRDTLRGRLGLWGVTLAGVYAIGQVNAPPGLREVVTAGADGRPVVTVEEGEARLTWRLGNTEKHCASCAGFNGQTMTAGEWRAMGIAPQSPDLDCGGWQCDCRWEEA